MLSNPLNQLPCKLELPFSELVRVPGRCCKPLEEPLVTFDVTLERKR